MSLLLFWQEAGTPPVTGTATFDQAAASWAATLTERIAATATFAQSASWDATATERFTSTAAFVQAAATWDAAGVERLTATAQWVQDAAAWSATGSQVEPVTGTATFTQEAAEWASLVSERLDATAASFLQAPAAFSADATEEHATTAEFTQDAAAFGASGNVSTVPVTGTATWMQEAASWLAGDSAPASPVVSGGSYSRYVKWTTPKKVLKPKVRPKVVPQPVTAIATFVQQPATWRAEMEVVESDDWLLGIGDSDEALLALV